MKTLFDEDYTGTRYTYGFTYRPLGISCQPDGWIIGSKKMHKDYKYGAVDWPFELSEKDLCAYELTKIETETE